MVASLLTGDGDEAEIADRGADGSCVALDEGEGKRRDDAGNEDGDQRIENRLVRARRAEIEGEVSPAIGRGNDDAAGGCDIRHGVLSVLAQFRTENRSC